MSRILLADDSPHAQRMGERILREEGFEVVSVTDGETALLRLADVDPDLIIADVSLPRKSGYELCGYVKTHPRHRHARVVLTAGLLEPVDGAQLKAAHSDGVLKKPFEASVMLDTIRPLIEAAEAERAKLPAGQAAEIVPVRTVAPAAAGPRSERPLQLSSGEEMPVIRPRLRPALEIDPEAVRAAVTLALDAALPAIVDEVTAKVLLALKSE